MPTTKNSTTTEQIKTELSATETFELLSNDRRYCALEYLLQAVGAAPVSELAEHITLSEGEHIHEQYERVCTSLVHVHLPKLTHAELIEYDRDSETVEVVGAADQIRPYLDLAQADRVR